MFQKRYTYLASSNNTEQENVFVKENTRKDSPNWRMVRYAKEEGAACAINESKSAKLSAGGRMVSVQHVFRITYWDSRSGGEVWQNPIVEKSLKEVETQLGRVQ